MNVFPRSVAIGLIAASLIGVGRPAKSETISTWQATIGTGVYGVYTDMAVDLGDVLNFYQDTDPYLHWTISESDVGQTIYRDATDQQFAAFVAHLTNGIDNDFVLRYPGTGSPNLESGIFGGVVGGNGIDLRGFQIEKVGLRVDSLSLVSPGEDPNGDGEWTDISGQLSFLFEGVPAAPVPEIDPAGMGSVLAMVAGAIGLFERRRLKTA